MKIIPKTEEEKRKEKITLYRNCINAGLEPMGNDIFTDGEEFFRFGSPRKVSEIKNIIKERYDGNKGSYSVQMHDFENIIDDDILCVLINRRVEALLKRRVKEEMSAIGLSTSIPENVYDPDRDAPARPYYDSFDNYQTEHISFSFTEEDENGY
jgi:hypothetical protein